MLDKTADISATNTFEKEMVEVLQKIIMVLEKNSIEYWLIGGSLLGLIRDNKFIPWDDDIEIGLWINDRENVIKHLSQFEKKGLGTITTTSDKIKFDLNYKNKSSEKIVFRGARLLFFKQFNGKSVRGAFYAKSLFGKSLVMLFNLLFNYNSKKVKSDNRNKFLFKIDFIHKISRNIFDMIVNFYCFIRKKARFTYEIPFEYFESSVKKTFYNKEVSIPSRAEEYLSFRYGETWTKPQRTWVDNSDITKPKYSC